MKGMIYKITLEDMQALISRPMDDNTLKVAKLSRWLLAGIYDNELLCFMGLVPPTLLSDQAYLWLLPQEGLKDHKVAFGRAAHKFIKNMLTIYPVLVGHCEPYAKQWLHSLGAEIGPASDNLATFRITR